MSLVTTLVAFVLMILAARQIGSLFVRLRLPLITGYLLTGVIAGPFVIGNLMLEQVESLRFLDEITLSFIAFVAGSELNIPELRGRLRSIAWYTVSITVTVFLFIVVAVLLLADSVPFLQAMPGSARLAVALLAGSVLIARSPSSAIAIVNELRARGPFTKTVLGVTIVMDVVVITFFAVTTSVVDVILTAEGFNILFVLLLVAELALSILSGFMVGKLLELALSANIHRLAKIALMLTIGFVVFNASHMFREYTAEHLPFEILLEPLLICMVGSFYITNFTRHRPEFLEMVEDAAPTVFLIFFVLVGGALRLDILTLMIPVTIVLFGVRLLGLFIGSLAGGTIAGDPLAHRRIAWMGYVTQAGIGLGLAREAAVEFPQLGDQFGTLIVSVIVVNQVVGPPLLSYAIKHLGESRLHAQPEPDEVRDAVILGITDQSQALARQLMAHNWQVIMADTDPDHVAHVNGNGLDAHLLPEISSDTLNGLVTRATDALVVMMVDDDVNFQACELAYEQLGIPRVIAQLNDYALAERFRECGVHVIYPASAMVNLLDQFVRAPQTAALLMHEDADSETVQITVTNPDIDNLRLRDLRLPGDVLVLGIMRDGVPIVPHGHTVLKFSDDVTLIGQPSSLDEVTLRLGF